MSNLKTSHRKRKYGHLTFSGLIQTPMSLLRSPVSQHPAANHLLEFVPDEIWSEIFKFLPHDTLIHLHIAESRFHRIARPLLFHEFDFHPYGLTGRTNVTECHPSAFALPQEQHVAFLLQRLKFWSSKEIAPFIRICRITPWSFTAETYRSLGWEICNLTSPIVVLLAFFHSLPRFTNLRHLVARYVPFDGIGIQNLSLLPKLSRVEIKWCLIIHSTPTQLSLSSFSLTTTHQSTGNTWLPILRTDTLRSLDIPLHNEPLIAQICAGGPFPRVTDLRIEVAEPTLSHLRILPKFPATETLNIREQVIDTDFGWRSSKLKESDLLSDIVSQGLSSLREYTGPHKFFYLFFPIPTLQRITIRRCNPINFLSCIDTLGPSTTITSLNLQFDGLSMLVLKLLCYKFFPNLAELHLFIASQVEGSEPGEELETFFHELAGHSPLPRSMRQLVILWRLASPVRQDALKLPALKARLFARHRGLQSIRFEGSSSGKFRIGHGVALATQCVTRSPPAWPDSHCLTPH
ncbi:hypothetical protein B0H19DRAFT_303964 [Mycena capillaripes]|nr:hypothetical protein B0H19DRAFT_303964 [Mycena capillaripes]